MSNNPKAERDGRGEAICELVFGDDWSKCVSPRGRRRLADRVGDGELIAYEIEPRWLQQDDPPKGIGTNQVQYQLLTAQLAIGSAYDSAEEAPDGVNDALHHIQNAMTQVGELR